MNGVPNALEGVRVIDLSQFMAGPICTVSLAQMGAEVIKIERPVLGEQGRPKGGGQDLSWALVHANKKGITLDLKSGEGKEILAGLIAVSDVLIENFAPGAIERLGFGYERVRGINPRCIFCQIKGYSQYSPYGEFPAMDGPVQCTGTIASQTGLLNSPPVISNVALADDPTGRFALSAVLAALYQREKTGRGQHVRVNMQEVMVSMSRSAFSLPTESRRRGHPMVFAGKKAPRDMFRTKPEREDDENNYIFIMVNDTPGQKAWKTFCNTIERPDLLDDPRYTDGENRLKNTGTLYPEITAWTMQRTKHEAMRILCENGVIAGAVLTVRDILNSEDMYQSGILHRLHHPTLGDIVIQGSPYHMSDTYVEPAAAPDLGQHNEEIYKGLLGLDDAEMEKLRESDVI